MTAMWKMDYDMVTVASDMTREYLMMGVGTAAGHVGRFVLLLSCWTLMELIQGYLILPDGSEFRGNFDENLKNGSGTMLYPSGNSYSGEWLHNQRHGFGTMTWVNPKEIYRGEWKVSA